MDEYERVFNSLLLRVSRTSVINEELMQEVMDDMAFKESLQESVS